MTGKPKVLYFVERYAQFSETYVENEVRALAGRYRIRVLCQQPPFMLLPDHLLPYTVIRTPEHVMDVGSDFAPDVVHGHYLTRIERVSHTARMLQVPFTLRAHSFDILSATPGNLARWSSFANAEDCLGILTFPYTVPWLVKAGFKESKLVPCGPVVNVQAFANRDPNGEAIMNTGAAIPKKSMEDYIDLGCLLPDLEFNFYPLGYDTRKLSAYNQSKGNPISIMKPAHPTAMPGEYKKHRWMVYTANRKMNTVGWPCAIAEAQASGVGVCMANIRPDLKDYVGDCGFLYDDLDQAAKIISRPFPEELRERGFELAWRSDIRRHIHLLEDLWPQPR